MDVLEGVEVGGGGGEALHVGVEGIGGDKVCATASDDLDAGLDGAVADGSLSVGGEGEVASEVCVAAENEEAGLTEGDVAPNDLQAEGNLAEGCGPAEGAFEREDAGVGGVGVSSGGMGSKAKMPLPGIGEPEGEVGVGEGDGSFFVAELEIEAGAGCFDVGEARGGAAFFLIGGSGLDLGGVEEDAVEVPLAIGEMNEINAGGR